MKMKKSEQYELLSKKVLSYRSIDFVKEFYPELIDAFETHDKIVNIITDEPFFIIKTIEQLHKHIPICSNKIIGTRLGLYYDNLNAFCNFKIESISLKSSKIEAKQKPVVNDDSIIGQSLISNFDIFISNPIIPKKNEAIEMDVFESRLHSVDNKTNLNAIYMSYRDFLTKVMNVLLSKRTGKSYNKIILEPIFVINTIDMNPKGLTEALKLIKNDIELMYNIFKSRDRTNTIIELNQKIILISDAPLSEELYIKNYNVSVTTHKRMSKVYEFLIDSFEYIKFSLNQLSMDVGNDLTAMSNANKIVELETSLRDIAPHYKFTAYTKDDIQLLAKASAGLSINEVISIIVKANKEKRKLDIKELINRRYEKYKDNDVVQFLNPVPIENIGGMDGIKEFLKMVKATYSQEFIQQYPKAKKPSAILLVGMGGTGKTLIAKAIASVLDKPLIQLQIEALKNKWVGESEKNVYKAFSIIETIGDCVVFTDEIEKSLSGLESSSFTNGGTTASIYSIVLQKMQEFMDKRLNIFFVASSNNIKQLSTPLLRRYQSIFFVDLPTEKERKAIFEIQFKLNGIDSNNFDIEKLAEVSDGLTGYDIDRLVSEFISYCFMNKTDLTTDNMIYYMQNHFYSVANERKEEIEEYRQMCIEKGWKIANSSDTIIAEDTNLDFITF